MTRRLRLLALTACACATGMIAATSAFAVFPGTNGKIAFANNPDTPGGNTDIYTMDANGANRVPLAQTPDDEFDPSYSADGEKIAFSRDPFVSNPTLGPQIWVMNHNGTGATQLTSGNAAFDFEPAFSPDGSKIAFEREIAGEPQIFIMNADGTGQTQLTFPGPTGVFNHAHSPQFSPDGTKIVFSFLDDAVGGHNIATIAPNGTGFTNLTPPSATTDDFQPSYSPNGAKILFARNGAITAMEANGTGVTPLTTPLPGGGDDFVPTFSPEGTQYLFERGDAAGTGGVLFLGNPAGLDIGLSQIPGQLPGFNFNPSWQALNPPACSIGPDIKTNKYGKVNVTATCTNENAAITAEGKGKAKKVGRAVAAKAKKFTIPPVNALALANVPTTVTLKIPKGAKKALKRAAKAGKKGKATITATVLDDLGQTATDTVAVTFKPKR